MTGIAPRFNTVARQAQRFAGENYGWGYTFFGGLPGAAPVLYQSVTENSSTTNGLELAICFNNRNGVSGNGPNNDALSGVLSVVTNITAWPTNGGGEIQWVSPAAGVVENAGSLTLQLVQSQRHGHLAMPPRNRSSSVNRRHLQRSERSTRTSSASIQKFRSPSRR